MEKGVAIEKTEGKLGIMLVGLGAVATTVIAGVELVRKGLAKPIGSLTQMSTIRLGKRTENRFPKIRAVPGGGRLRRRQCQARPRTLFPSHSSALGQDAQYRESPRG